MHATARRDIGLELTRAEYGLIVDGLVERPFIQVYELIGQLHGAVAGGDERARVTLSPAQLRLILDTLGGMPFARVSRMLQSMHQQMQSGRH